MNKTKINFLFYIGIAILAFHFIGELNWSTVSVSIILGYIGSIVIEKLPFLYKKLSNEEILIPYLITYFTITVLIVAAVMIPDYFKPVKYVYSNNVFYNILAKMNKDTVSNSTMAGRLEVTLSTKQAYVPAQPITANVTWTIPKTLSSMFDRSELYVWFSRSKAVKAKVMSNGEMKYINLKDTALRMVNDEINIDLQKDGIVTLTRINDTFFTGEREIFYNSPGQHAYVFFDRHLPVIESEEYISIGSTVDLSTVKNNRIILLLTIYVIALTFILAFKK